MLLKQMEMLREWGIRLNKIIVQAPALAFPALAPFSSHARHRIRLPAGKVVFRWNVT
eukprot:00481_5